MSGREREGAAAPGPPSYAVAGFLEEGFGLAVAARNTVRALEASGRCVERVTIRHGGAGAAPRRAGMARARATVFHVNPSDVAQYADQWRPAVDPSAPTVCVPFWEMPLVPRAWEGILSGLDAVLAPTRFILEACARSIPRDRVVLHPQAVFHPEVRPAREAWGLPPGATVFTLSFDVGSDIERKNPWAGIEAFTRAFPSNRDVALVIKTKPYPQVPAYRAQARELAARIQGDDRIRVIERTLSYEEVLQLYASCDVMLSLHRSEGLGLHLMEAMSVGRPVVATGWSGNVDFMTPENSVAIGWRLVPVRSDHPGYRTEIGREGQVWAEAELGDAVDALRGLHANRERRLEMGAAAARDMERRRSEVLSGATFDALERLLPPVSRDPRGFARAVREERARLRWATLRRRALLAVRMALGRP